MSCPPPPVGCPRHSTGGGTGFGMLKDVLDQLGSLTLEEKRAVEEAARAAVARELGAVFDNL